MTDTDHPGQLPLHGSGLHKSYGSKKALAGVDVQLQAGEFHALLGPNGAGKSTLLQLLTGLFNPDQGNIRVMGEDLRRHPARALAHIGVVFQQPALDLNLSIESNLLFHTDLHGLPRALARQRIAQGLQLMGLDADPRQRAETLSGGMRRKVELVRAWLHRPAVLLMDEATAGLDPASRVQLLQSVSALCKREGTAVLWATHLLDEAEMADSLTLLDKGRVLFSGSHAAFVQQGGGGGFQDVAMRMLGVASAV